MARYVTGWICEGCEQFVRSQPWDCPGCKKEICDNCFYATAHCEQCAEGKTDNELAIAANAVGWEFELDEGGR